MKSKTGTKTVVKKEMVTADKPSKSQQKEKKIDPYSLEDIPGMGPTAIKMLAEKAKFYNALQVVHKNPIWLRDITGMDADKATQAFGIMKKRLIDAGVLWKQEMNGTENLALRKTVQRIKTGCKVFDNFLGGGFETRSITMLFGENGSGKTQTCFNECIMVQKPIEEGGLAEPNKAPPMVLYIDTEGTYRSERIVSMLAGKKMITDHSEKIKKKMLEGKVLTIDEMKEYEAVKAKQEKEAEPWLDNIIVQRVTDAGQQMDRIHTAIDMVQHVPIKLIIVDSGVAIFRSDFLGRGNIKSKFDLENEMIHDLRMIAENNNVCVIFVNQIYHSPTEDYGADPDRPYGGNVVNHAIPYLIKLSKSGRKHKARYIKSSYLDNNDIHFDIKQEGLVDPE